MDPPMRSRRIRGLVAAATALVGAVLISALAGISLWTRAGLQIDTHAMDAVYARSDVLTQILRYLGYISIGTAGVVLLVLVAVAFARGDRRAALGAIVLVGGSNVTTQVIKRYILDRPDWFDRLPNSLPSGHTTMIVSLVLAGLIVVPSALRYPSVMGATALATLTGPSTVVAGWHRPAAVLAALSVCLTWGAVVALFVRRPTEYRRVPTLLWSFGGAIAAGAVLITIGVRPLGGWTGFIDAAVVLSVLGIATALTITVFALVISPFQVRRAGDGAEDRAQP